ncbi:MBL fold metallo-hydrolase [Candidatus Woesearchaeota archaeon]|nr:MBL fold metallo-hydrolase [Candidatus Woesearchaeota archaeon]
MKLIFHGGVKEVGKLCIEVDTKSSRFLLDCGVKLGTETEYPNVPKNPKQIDAAIISHAHLDHCAGLPYMNSKGLNCPIFLTQHSKEIAKILIKDFFHVESLTGIPEYKRENLINVFNQMKGKDFIHRFKIRDADFQFFDAGHIPGSAIIVVEADGKRLAFTGDINTTDTQLMKGASLDIGEVDVLISETTYGDREHPDRKQTEKEFLAKVREVIRRGGTVFVPVFGVGRAQEILLLLNKEKWNVPIYLDGMAQEVTDLIIQQNSCKNQRALIDAKNNTNYIEGRENREKAVRKQGIFITTSGMLSGGPIMDYLKFGYQNPKNAFLLTGYVIEGTNGRLLLDEGSVFLEGKKINVKAEYVQFDFSAHSGMSELKRIIQKLNPRKLILLHGSENSIKNIANEEKKKNRDVFTPNIGDEIYI